MLFTTIYRPNSFSSRPWIESIESAMQLDLLFVVALITLSAPQASHPFSSGPLLPFAQCGTCTEVVSLPAFVLSPGAD